ncbi:MAG: transglutaminase-like domain-containing protein [archaeon]|jgi:transglutaminase-like putative cysteine protease|nr:transglutaminase-like domain-containing protein [archaeon]
MIKKILPLLAILLLASTCAAQELPFPSTVQEIDARVVLSATGTISGKLLTPVKLNVLSFQNTAEQGITQLKQILEINGKTIEAKTKLDDYGNQYAIFEINERGTFTYKIEAMVHKKVRPRGLKDFNLSQNITEFEEYLEETKYIESNDAGMRTLALNRFPKDSWLETVAEVIDWTHKYVTYDKTYFPEVYSAKETYRNKRGTCDEFAVLSAAMLRAKGIPTRVIVGPVFSAQEWNFHGWLEAYNPEAGWVPIDSTYGEAGLVDATHIEMGHFPDFENAADIVTSSQGTIVQVLPKTVDVTLIDYVTFSDVISVKAERKEIKANSWQDINTTIENNLDNFVIVPVEIVMPKGFLIEGGQQTLLLKPLEKISLSWKTIIKREIDPGHYLSGNYSVFSAHPAVESKITIFPGEESSEGALAKVIDLYGYLDLNTMKIEIYLQNLGNEDAEVDISLKTREKEIESQNQTITALSKKRVVLSVENFEDAEYFVTVNSPDLIYSAKIIPQKGVVASETHAPKEEPKNDEEPKDETPISPENGLETDKSLPLEGVIVIIGVFVAIFVAMFLLKTLVIK